MKMKVGLFAILTLVLFQAAFGQVDSALTAKTKNVKTFILIQKTSLTLNSSPAKDNLVSPLIQLRVRTVARYMDFGF